MPDLFDALKLGDITLPNRIIMAPLTRTRAGSERVPNALMAEYYRQRASAGLIISEATSISPLGVGYPDTPGIWSAEQVEGWRLVTTAVHQAGGRIFLQLWHVGRISDPIYLQGQLPVSASAIAAEGHVSLVRPERNYVTPRALAIDEIAEIVEQYRQGAINAKEAGFDGVEIHGANGYLLDQFLQDSTNQRSDSYGGCVENRARFALEATEAAISVWGPGRVGVHIAPRCDAHSMGDSNPKATFGYLVAELSKRQVAFVCARESLAAPRVGPHLRSLFTGVYIVNDGFTKDTAEQALQNSEADAVAFGRLFIANPDLPKRFQLGAGLNTPDPSTFYLPGAGAEGVRGYTDYPAL